MSDPYAKAIPPSGRRSPFKKRRVWAALILLSLTIVVLFALLLLYSTPAWYQPPDGKDLAVIDDAEVFQKRLFDLQNKLQATPLGEQTWVIEERVVNAFLAIQYGARESKDGSVPKYSGPMVHFVPGNVIIAVRTPRVPGRDPNGGVATVTLRVRTVPPEPNVKIPGNMGQVFVEGVTVGSLPVPSFIVADKLKNMSPMLEPVLKEALAMHNAEDELPMAMEILTRGLHGEPFTMSFSFRRRPITVKEIRVTEGKFSITFAKPESTSPLP